MPEEKNPFHETGMSRGKSVLEMRLVLLIVGALILAGVLVTAVFGGLGRERPTGEGTIIDPGAYEGEYGQRRPPPPKP